MHLFSPISFVLKLFRIQFSRCMNKAYNKQLRPIPLNLDFCHVQENVTETYSSVPGWNP